MFLYKSKFVSPFSALFIAFWLFVILCSVNFTYAEDPIYGGDYNDPSLLLPSQTYQQDLERGGTDGSSSIYNQDLERGTGATSPSQVQTQSQTPGIPFGSQTPGIPFGSQTQSPSGFFGLTNPLAFDTIQGLVSAILNIIVTVGTPIAIFFFVYAGFLYTTARGNETQITKAHNTFLWTAIGALVLLGATLLSDVLKGTVEQITGRSF